MSVFAAVFRDCVEKVMEVSAAIATAASTVEDLNDTVDLDSPNGSIDPLVADAKRVDGT